MSTTIKQTRVGCSYRTDKFLSEQQAPAFQKSRRGMRSGRYSHLNAQAHKSYPQRPPWRAFAGRTAACAGDSSQPLPKICPGRPVTCARLVAPRRATCVCTVPPAAAAGSVDGGGGTSPPCSNARTVPLDRSCAAMALRPIKALPVGAAAGDGSGPADPHSWPGLLGGTWSLPRSRLESSEAGADSGRSSCCTPWLSFPTRPLAGTGEERAAG